MERENIDKGILFQFQYFFLKFLVCFKIFLRFYYIWERSLFFFLKRLLSKSEKYDDTNLVNDIRYLYFFFFKYWNWIKQKIKTNAVRGLSRCFFFFFFALLVYVLKQTLYSCKRKIKISWEFIENKVAHTIISLNCIVSSISAAAPE